MKADRLEFLANQMQLLGAYGEFKVNVRLDAGVDIPKLREELDLRGFQLVRLPGGFYAIDEQ